MATSGAQVRDKLRASGPRAPSNPAYTGRHRSGNQTSTGAGAGQVTNRLRTGAPRQSGRRTQGLTDIAALESVRDINKAVNKYTGSHTGGLIAEWAAGMFLIAWGIFTGGKSYLEGMSDALWRMTALTFVFFILALVARGDKSGKVALAFGGIVDLGILFHATQTGVVKGIGQIVSGQGIGADTTTLDSDLQTTEPTSSVSFPDDSSSTAASSSVSTV